MEWSQEGTGNIGVVSRMEREMRGTRLGVAGVLHYRLQCATVATAVDAGEVFEEMPA